MGFAKNIYRLRKQKGLTQFELADKLSIIRSTYASYEQNKACPSLDKLKEIADFFRVDYNTLLGEPSATTPREDVALLALFHQLEETDQEEILGLIKLKLSLKKDTGLRATSSI